MGSVGFPHEYEDCYGCHANDDDDYYLKEHLRNPKEVVLNFIVHAYKLVLRRVKIGKVQMVFSFFRADKAVTEAANIFKGCFDGSVGIGYPKI